MILGGIAVWYLFIRIIAIIDSINYRSLNGGNSILSPSYNVLCLIRLCDIQIEKKITNKALAADIMGFTD